MNFQEQESWEEDSMNDDGDFTVSSQIHEGCQHMRPSILNKSSMHCMNLSHKSLQSLPQIPPKTQKLDMSHNLLRTLPLHLANLKQLQLSHNLIERIPDDLNDITSLSILRLSHNLITTLPYLKHVRHLQLINNPIRVISTRLDETKLQFLSFDWIPFLVDARFQESDRQTILALSELIQNVRKDELEQFIDFHPLYEGKKNQNSLVYSLHKAILKRNNFFISYLKDYHSDTNFNQLIFLDVPLLQQALEESYDLAIELFMLRKGNLSSKPVYMMNLLLACQFSHLELFNFVVGLKRCVLLENQDQIISTIFKHFDPNGASPIILKKFLKYCNFSPSNPKIFRLPQRYNIIFADSIAKGIFYVLKDQELSYLIDFKDATCNSSQEPLLHFAVSARKPELVKQLLESFPCSFSKNEGGKSARLIRGSALSRKLIWKEEKRALRQKILGEDQQVEKMMKSQEERENWMKMVFTPQKLQRKQKQFVMKEESDLMGFRIDLTLKDLANREKILQLRKSRREETMSEPSIIQQDHFNQKDRCGFITDINLNYGIKNGKEIKVQANENQNVLVLYEIWRNSQVKTILHDYMKKDEKSKKKSQGFFVSPLGFCQDVEDDTKDEDEFVIDKSKQMRIKEISRGTSPRVISIGKSQTAIV